MTLAAVIAIPILLLGGGAAVAASYFMTRRERREIERRTELVSIRRKRDRLAATRARKAAFDVSTRAFFSAGYSQTWGMRSAGAKLVAVAGIATAVTYFGVYLGFGWYIWLSALTAAAVGYLLPRLILLREQKKQEHEFTELFPDAVDAMGRMLRAGLPITTAIRTVSTDAPHPVCDAFGTIANQIEIGASLEDALDAASRAVALPDFRFFVVAVALQHATGGNLASTLEILSDIVRKRRAMRMKAQATTSEIRISAYVLAAIPFFVTGVLLVLQPGYLSPMFNDPRGQIMLAVAAGGLLLAGFTVRQMMRSAANA